MSDDSAAAGVDGLWDAVLDEMADVAAGYRDAGWTAVTFHPTDVSVVPRDAAEFGIATVVPDDEFDALVAAVDGRSFDAYEVFRADADERVFLLVVTESADGEVVVCLPAYYDRAPEGEGELRAHDGELYTRIRTLAGDEVVSFTHEDPAPFFPES